MPRAQPLLLLPPSEGKAPGGDGPGWPAGGTADRALDRHRRLVLRGAKAAGATPKRAGTVPAIERYTGVLYKELDWPSMPAVARRRGAEQVRIVSGLWGLVAPEDPLPPYKLKMSASLPELGKLSTWWRPRLAPVVASLARGRVVWDLLPIEHTAAMDWRTADPALRVTVRFVDQDDKTVSHWNKLLKGALVRWVLAEQPTGPDDLRRFEHPLRYRYDPAATQMGDGTAAIVLRAAS